MLQLIKHLSPESVSYL